MILLSLGLGFLAVSRLTRLFVEDKLLIGYRRWIVNHFGAESMVAYLAHCRWCSSVWISLFVIPPAVIWHDSVWTIAALAVPAASQVAGLLGRLEE